MESRADIDGVVESSSLVKELIENEMAVGIPSENIMLVGFSQGGVIALHLGTRLEHKLAGIVALSTYMCESQSLAYDKSTANSNTPILVCHGQQDEVVPVSLGKHAYNTLIDNGYQATWKEYVMQHNVCMPEVNDIAEFISTHLNKE